MNGDKENALTGRGNESRESPSLQRPRPASASTLAMDAAQHSGRLDEAEKALQRLIYASEPFIEPHRPPSRVKPRNPVEAEAQAALDEAREALARNHGLPRTRRLAGSVTAVSDHLDTVRAVIEDFYDGPPKHRTAALAALDAIGAAWGDVETAEAERTAARGVYDALVAFFAAAEKERA